MIRGDLQWDSQIRGGGQEVDARTAARARIASTINNPTENYGYRVKETQITISEDCHWGKTPTTWERLRRIDILNGGKSDKSFVKQGAL